MEGLLSTGPTPSSFVIDHYDLGPFKMGVHNITQLSTTLHCVKKFDFCPYFCYMYRLVWHFETVLSKRAVTFCVYTKIYKPKFELLTCSRQPIFFSQLFYCQGCTNFKEQYLAYQ